MLYLHFHENEVETMPGPHTRPQSFETLDYEWPRIVIIDDMNKFHQFKKYAPVFSYLPFSDWYFTPCSRMVHL